MSTLKGTLTDFALDALNDFPVQLFFTASQAAVKNGRILTDKPVEANVASNGSFSVTLESTDGMIPTGVYYTASIDQGMRHYDVLGLRIYLPEGEWRISDLPGTPLSAYTVLVSLDPPPVGYHGWYLNSGTGSPDDTSKSGTGMLSIAS